MALRLLCAPPVQFFGAVLATNTAGRLPGVAAPLPGIDLRGDGGYVVAAPSRHRSGATYHWVNPAIPVAAAPSWLRLPPRPLCNTLASPRPVPYGGGSRYGLAALWAELADVRAAPIGDRNNRLNRAAFSLGMLTAGGELDPDLVEDELLAAALDLGLPEHWRSTTSSMSTGCAPASG